MNQHYKERSVDLAAGLRGRLGSRFDWDVTLSRADFERTRRRMVGNLVNDFFFGSKIGTRPNGVPIYRMNMERWLRPMTPVEYASISTTARYEAESWVSTGSFVLTGDLFDLPAGPVGMAAILEASSQGYELNSDPRVQPGVVQLYNLTGTNGGGERDRYAAGIEFSIPIFSTLKASLAGRFDKYDDITAAAKTWNAGLEWRPTDALLIRGSYATSFKAPDLHWVFSEGSGSFALPSIPGAASWPAQIQAVPDIVTACSRSPRVIRNLEEETGKSWSAGFVWDIAEGLSANVDYWDIELNGALERLSTASILQSEAGCRTGLTLSGQPFGFSPDSAYCQQISALVTRIPKMARPSIGSGKCVRHRSTSPRRVAGIDAGCVVFFTVV